MSGPQKGYPSLRIGRSSAEGAEYFLTLCAQRPCHALAHPAVIEAAQRQCRELESSGAWEVRSAVFMPDHAHLLIRLGGVESLSAVVRKFKGPLAGILRIHSAKWQPAFYDHRLRNTDNVLPVFLYIFLNPYRAGLCEAGRKWPGYYCRPEDWEWFGAMTDRSCPEPEWLL